VTSLHDLLPVSLASKGMNSLHAASSLLSDNGGGLIGNNGGNIVGNNGSSLIGKVKYGTLQTAGVGGTSAVPEFLLAEAQIEVLDAAGNVLVDKDKKPITAKTDLKGDYAFKAGLPNENLILRIRLFNGGQLFAFATKNTGTTAARTLDINTASSLGAAYVMEKYVQKKQAVLDLLPQLEAEKLQLDMEAARVHMASAVPTYLPQEQVSLAEELRGKAPALNQTIERIEAILLAGQKNLGDGLKANQVTIGGPSAMAADAQGNLFIAEATVGRIRKVAPDGTVSVFVGPGGPAGRDSSLGLISDMVMDKQGALYVIKDRAQQVAKITPDGQVTTFAGTGIEATGPMGGKASASPLSEPRELAVAPDGTIYILEHGTSAVGGGGPRLLYVDAQGNLQQVETPFAALGDGLRGMAFAPDGTLYMLHRYDGASGNGKTDFYRKSPTGAWELIMKAMPSPAWDRALIAPDGTFYVLDDGRSRISKLNVTTTEQTPIAGTGVPGYSGDGGPATAAQLNEPDSMWISPAGTIYVADRGNNLVRAIAKNGTISTFAGTVGLTQVGDALAVAINQPGGLALDSQGRLVVTEVASHTIKRLDGQTLTRIAGSIRGFSGDGGPATAATFNAPGGIAYLNNELYVMDAANYRIRKIDSAGVVTTVAGTGKSGRHGEPKIPALEARLKQPFAMILSPEGWPYWSDTRQHQILRLKDGFVEAVAGVEPEDEKGSDAGDGGPAVAAKLNAPAGLAFDKDGNLYFADTGNLRIRKVDKAGIITTFAGITLSQAFPLVLGGQSATQNGEAANKTLLWAPVGLLFDAQGNLLVSEAGTVNAGVAGDSTDKFGGALTALPKDLLPKIYARLRKVPPDGKVVNVTGPGTSLLADTQGDDMLLLPLGFIFDKDGRLVIADAGLNQLKVLPKGSF
jgi:sugar lactone lactonase YvrE